MKNPDSWKNLDIVKVLKEKRFYSYGESRSFVFSKRMGSDVGVKPGEEMKAALRRQKIKVFRLLWWIVLYRQHYAAPGL